MQYFAAVMMQFSRQSVAEASLPQGRYIADVVYSRASLADVLLAGILCPQTQITG